MKQIFIIPFSLLVFTSCNNNAKIEYKNRASVENKINSHPGKKLMEAKCYVCHSPSANHKNRVAPPMVAIKKHYISKNTTKEEFVTAIKSWIKKPNVEDAKMYGAVKRFGVMPLTPFPEETIEQIADYMFDNEIEEPKWFKEHFNKNH